MTIDNLLMCLDDPFLPFLQWQDRFSVAESRLPKYLQMEIEEIMSSCDIQAAHDAEWSGLEQVDEFPAQLLLGVMKNALKVNSRNVKLLGNLAMLTRHIKSWLECHISQAGIQHIIDKIVLLGMLNFLWLTPGMCGRG